jgi:prevent-host-death family protein|nr:type II toxin-antitoxin system prevent-host-death family antitoxin [Candidatus Acidoferrales bacterium]
MRTVGLFEAKQKFSELVERANEGERIAITRRGKLAAYLIPAKPARSVKEIFEDIDVVRKRTKRIKGLTIRAMIEEGRM